MKNVHVRAGPLLCLLVAMALSGCDDGQAGREERRRLQEQARRAQEQAEQQRRQLQEAQRQREQDRRVLEASKDEGESDTSAAVLMWAACAVSLAVVIGLLARERRLRNVLQRLLGLILGKRERGP